MEEHQIMEIKIFPYSMMIPSDRIFYQKLSQENLESFDFRLVNCPTVVYIDNELVEIYTYAICDNDVFMIYVNTKSRTPDVFTSLNEEDNETIVTSVLVKENLLPLFNRIDVAKGKKNTLTPDQRSVTIVCSNNNIGKNKFICANMTEEVIGLICILDNIVDHIKEVTSCDIGEYILFNQKPEEES